MNINDLSIADLKAAYDFVLLDIDELEQKANSENISFERIPAYKEVKVVENKLWTELLNRTRLL